MNCTPAGAALRTVFAAPADTSPPRLARNALGNPILFHGQYFDYETGFSYLRARHYDPHAGEFLQRDPVEYADSPQPYAAFRHNPVAFRDPTGREVPIGPQSAKDVPTPAYKSYAGDRLEFNDEGKKWRDFILKTYGPTIETAAKAQGVDPADVAGWLLWEIPARPDTLFGMETPVSSDKVSDLLEDFDTYREYKSDPSVGLANLKVGLGSVTERFGAFERVATSSSTPEGIRTRVSDSLPMDLRVELAYKDPEASIHILAATYAGIRDEIKKTRPGAMPMFSQTAPIIVEKNWDILPAVLAELPDAQLREIEYAKQHFERKKRKGENEK